MNVEEVTQVVALVRSLYPAQRFDGDPRNVIAAWGAVLGDLEFAETRAAVVRISRRGLQWCSPGDVRREAAAARNVLAPDVTQLVQDIRHVASAQGAGRTQLHPAARDVYASTGGAEAIKRLDGYGLQRLARAVEQAVEQYDRRTLESDQLPPAAPAHVPLEAVRNSEPAAITQRNPAPVPEHVRKAIAELGKMPS